MGTRNRGRAGAPGHRYHAAMSRPTVMTFPTLDQAESALDWIGIELADADGGFEGELVADDLDLLDEALGDAETPGPVRVLAAALRELLAANPDGAAWRVTYTA
jgi:hypothetical protein